MSEEKGKGNNKVSLIALGCAAELVMAATLAFTTQRSLASFVAGGFAASAAFFWAAAMWGGE